ncbi:hypothetical protein Q3G72_020630 [Acer saccharum]|nr:hypothetical protein Q3G72_020630 [Acer saccharum]
MMILGEENAVSIAEHFVRILKEEFSGAIPILVNLYSDGNVEVRERLSVVIVKFSYDEADRVALADTGAVRQCHL